MNKLLPTFFALVALSTPAWALPGYSLQQELQWANQNDFLLQLQEGKDAAGALYSSERVTGKGSRIRFEARLKEGGNPVIYSESILIFPSVQDLASKDISVHFDTQHKALFSSVMSAIYGPMITTDYDSIETEIKMNIKNTIDIYYRGRTYGYVFSLHDKKHYSLTIYELYDYYRILDAAKAQKKNQPVDINLFGS